MNCIFLLLLLSCCSGFGGDNRSGCGDRSPRGNGNNGRNGFPSVGSDCGYQEATPLSGSDCGCGDNNQGIRSVPDGNPSNWQDYPEISRRENCDCCEQ